MQPQKRPQAPLLGVQTGHLGKEASSQRQAPSPGKRLELCGGVGDKLLGLLSDWVVLAYYVQ